MSTRKHPDLDELATRADGQRDALFFTRLPRELRRGIYNQLWRGYGIVQHTFTNKDGQFTHAPCITDHSAPDDRQEECAKLDVDSSGDFINFTMGRRLHSPWGNHWKCQEALQSQQTKRTSPFLHVLLTCRKLYLECRSSIYESLTFVFHDAQTLHDFTVLRRQPIVDSIRFVNMSIMLPIHPDETRMEAGAVATMTLWREACAALSQAESLVSVNLWLDTIDHGYRHLLNNVPTVNPFIFEKRLASVLTVNIPADPDSPEVWQDITFIKPSFAVRARGWPRYMSEGHWQHGIVRLDDYETPGSAPPPVGYITATASSGKPILPELLRRLY